MKRLYVRFEFNEKVSKNRIHILLDFLLTKYNSSLLELRFYEIEKY